MLLYLLVFPGCVPSNGQRLQWPRRAVSAAAVLERAGHGVRLFDLRRPRSDLDQLIELLEGENPDHLLIDTLDGCEQGLSELISRFRAVCSARITLVGSSAPRGRLPLLCRRIGLDGWFEGSYDLHVDPSPRRQDPLFRGDPIGVRDMPTPAWHHLDQASYSGRSNRRPEYWVEGTLLDSGASQPGPERIRPPDQVARDIDILLCHWPRVRGGVIHLHDDLAAGSTSYAEELTDRLRHKHLRLSLCTTREDVEEAALESLMRSGVGLLHLEIDVEPNGARRESRLRSVKRALRSAIGQGLRVSLGLQPAPGAAADQIQRWREVLATDPVPTSLDVRPAPSTVRRPAANGSGRGRWASAWERTIPRVLSRRRSISDVRGLRPEVIEMPGKDSGLVEPVPPVPALVDTVAGRQGARPPRSNAR